MASERSDDREEAPTEEGKAPPGKESPIRRVLVVDDDEMIQLLVSRALEGPDLEVRSARTLAEARSALSGTDYDAVVLDLVLPDGDGRRLLSEIREEARSAAVPVTVVSARGGRVDQLECFRLGTDEFFEKPFDPEILQAAVLRQLERVEAGRKEGSASSPATAPRGRRALDERYRELVDAGEGTGGSFVLARVLVEGLPDTGDAGRIAASVEETLRSRLRSADSVAEWGISDFVVILTETSTEAAKDLMQEALDALPATLSGADVSAVLAGPPHPEDLRSAVLRVDRGFLHSPRPSGGRIRILREGAEEGGDAPRILMVEDEMTTSTLVQHRLSREGMEVVHETDGGDALHRIQDEAAPPGFDLVLLDVNLPGAGGFQLLQAIRDRPGWRELPVVMLTGLGREADIVRAFEAGADDYMVKPFSPTELLARVQRLLRRPR